jgi:polycystin 1L2
VCDRYYFICDKWLAVEEGDGSVERLLPVASHQDFTSSFSYLFSTSARRKITSDHMWFSVVSRPTRSSFTRAQRLSCCIALLFLTMITNCMFFKNGGDASSDDVITLGPFQFTVSQLAISVETTIIVLIPSLVIALCFQKAK